MRTKSVYRCAECGGESPKWLGRCPACEAWNTLVEELETTSPGLALTVPGVALPISDIANISDATRSTGIGELDRVLGGGLVDGSVTLVGGEPGIGKSTLLLQALAGMAAVGRRCLLVTAEESAQQVRARAERLDAVRPELYLLSETALPHILATIEELRPAVVVVDSIQTIFDPALGSAPGSVAQVRECAHRLVREAKARGTAVVLVGHVTKDGGLAGPRVLEHVVDTVLSFEGERLHALRLLRAVKHRFGTTSELGLFEMGDAGLVGVPDASGLFLTDRRVGVAGSVVVPVLEGTRPLLVEMQALVSTVEYVPPRRAPQGVDGARLALVLAVLERHARLPLGKAEVYASAVGGVRVVEPGADLGLALAVASSLSSTPIGDDLVACGELGLGGELRQVGQTSRRLAEAARLGFRTALVPVSAPEPPAGMQVLRAATIGDALRQAGLPVGSRN